MNTNNLIVLRLAFHVMMSRKLKQLAVLAGFVLNLMLLLHAQDQLGFISIDCGLLGSLSYSETTTGINFISDATFLDTNAESKVVTLPDHYINTTQRPYWSLRSFPQGIRNCYKINVTNGIKYLIRASFFYGNYDSQFRLPEFQLHLGATMWDSVGFMKESTITNKELIHVAMRSYIHVCLVDTGSGVPFISALELRPLTNTSYPAANFGDSLALDQRCDTGQIANREYRYPDDVHDRLWYGYERDDWTQLSTASVIDSENLNTYQQPSIVMNTAATPKNANDSLNIFWQPSDNNANYTIYMHFAEVEKLQANQSRQLSIISNGELFYGPIVPDYLATDTVFSITAWSDGQYITLSIIKDENSTLPPIINAFEIYKVLSQSAETNQEDVDAITNIKSTLKIKRNWQGDPCAPQKYSWESVKCSYPENEPPRIISLNLSSSGLTGKIPTYISNLTMIQTLDLSNNSLTGSIPEFLSQLPKLNVLNLEKNNLTGSIPVGLMQRRKDGLLSLSLCENANLSGQVSCKEKKQYNIITTVVVLSNIVGIFILLSTVATIWWVCKRKRQHEIMMNYVHQNGMLESQGQRFTYSEIVKITNNLASMIGRGGFGNVYLGTLPKNEIQVAVKLLASSSRQGSKEFQNEVKLLMRAHHRNLVSLVGYCDEGDTMALVYDYVTNGNLQQHLSPDVTTNVLTWKERLQISVDAARGLDYLHNGCKPPIVHRDLKTSNILLNDNMQAKIADFGLSKGLGTESATHVLTDPKGTFGYLDPEYYNTGKLNKKSDIYSFGIMLLELITGKPAIIRDVEPSPIHICQWVSPKFERKEIESIVDSRIQGTYNNSSAWKAIEIAMACLPPTAIQRPDIIVVYNDLKECLEIEMPSEVTKITEIDENNIESDDSDDSFAMI